MATKKTDEAAAVEPAFSPIRGKPDMTVGYTTAEGDQATMEPDADGVFWPKSAEEVAVLETFDFPVARKAEAELKAAAAATPADAAPGDTEPPVHRGDAAVTATDKVTPAEAPKE